MSDDAEVNDTECQKPIAKDPTPHSEPAWRETCPQIKEKCAGYS